jgi:hypothetical protein
MNSQFSCVESSADGLQTLSCKKVHPYLTPLTPHPLDFYHGVGRPWTGATLSHTQDPGERAGWTDYVPT